MLSENRPLQAIQIFDLVDHFMKGLRVQGSRPRPFGNISIWAVGQIEKRNLQLFPKPWKLLMTVSPSGYYLYYGKIEFSDGTVRTGILANGQYHIRVESELYQVAEQTVVFPRKEKDPVVVFDLLPGHMYPFPSSANFSPTLLRGTIQNEKGNGVADVKIQTGDLTYLTDSSGQWVFAFSKDQFKEKVNVKFTFPDGKTKTRNLATEQGKMTSVPPLIWSSSG